MNFFATRPAWQESLSLRVKTGVVAGFVSFCSLLFLSCATRPTEAMSAGTGRDTVPQEGGSQTFVLSAPGSVASSKAGAADPVRPASNAPAIPLVSAKARGVENSAEVSPPPAMEEWMEAQLGREVVVRRGGAGKLLISRQPPKEPLPLFQEAIVLGELRALVRSSNKLQNSEVTFRNGSVSITTKEPLRSRGTVGMISEILEFPEVSEIRVFSLADGG